MSTSPPAGEDVVWLLKGRVPTPIGFGRTIAPRRRDAGWTSGDGDAAAGRREGLRKLPVARRKLTRMIHDLVVTGRLSRLGPVCGARWTLSCGSRQSGDRTIVAEHLHCDLGIARSKS